MSDSRDKILVYGYIKSLNKGVWLIPGDIMDVMISYSQLNEWLNGTNKVNRPGKFVGTIRFAPLDYIQYKQVNIGWTFKIIKIKNGLITVGYKPTEKQYVMLKEEKSIDNWVNFWRRMRNGGPFSRISTGDFIEISIKYVTGDYIDDYYHPYQTVIGKIMINKNVIQEKTWHHFWKEKESYNIQYHMVCKVEGEICETELCDCYEYFKVN